MYFVHWSRNVDVSAGSPHSGFHFSTEIQIPADSTVHHISRMFRCIITADLCHWPHASHWLLVFCPWIDNDVSVSGQASRWCMLRVSQLLKKGSPMCGCPGDDLIQPSMGIQLLVYHKLSYEFVTQRWVFMTHSKSALIFYSFPIELLSSFYYPFNVIILLELFKIK